MDNLTDVLNNGWNLWRKNNNPKLDLSFNTRTTKVGNEFVITVTVIYLNGNRKDTAVIYRSKEKYERDAIEKGKHDLEYLLAAKHQEIFTGNYPLQFYWGGPYETYKDVLLKELNTITTLLNNLL